MTAAQPELTPTWNMEPEAIPSGAHHHCIFECDHPQEFAFWGRWYSTLTPAELEELNAIAQNAHAEARSYRRGWVTVAAPLLARALDELARLRVEVEQLRAAFACPVCSVVGGHAADCPRLVPERYGK